MAKFITDYVNLIAINLRDRYKSGFPILKELVQNADDAVATSMAFGYHRGLMASASHELLQGPALWVLNNGRFNADDRQAIMSFGLNSKAAESGAIGKFGLGMKSVFHLCEAFFYVASDGRQHFHEVLSPWFQDAGSHEMHERWESVSRQDVEALDAVALGEPHVKEGQSWFMLWVPLRRRGHVPRADGALTAPIIDRYPGEAAGRDLDFFTEPGIDRHIGRLLPLLRNLQQIRFGGTDGLPAFDLQVELEADGKRLDHVTDGLRVRGTVADGGAKNSRLHFLARQFEVGGTAPFAQLQSSAGWPKSNAIVAAGKRAPVPDRGQPEGAVVVSHADKRRGHLTVQWAVFLPTEEVRFRYEAHIPDSSREYGITLHGQFFVDAGRRGIDGMDRLADQSGETKERSREAAVQLEWNQALAQQVVLPNVLLAIADYVQAEGLNDAQIAAFTDAVTRCATVGDSGSSASFVRTFLPHLCRENVWIRVLQPDGPAWEICSAQGHKFLSLPRPTGTDHDRPWRALPGLKDLSDVVFVDALAPRICGPLSHWDEELVSRSLNGLPPSTLTNEVELRYLVDFLGLHKGLALNTSLVQGQLVRLIRKGLQKCRLSDVRAHRQLFKQLVEFLPLASRFGLGTRAIDARGALPEAVYSRLLDIETAALLLPADLAPDGDSGRPAESDIEAWLGGLGSLVAQQVEVSGCLEAAEIVIAAMGSDREQKVNLLRRCHRLKVLKAVDVRENKDVATSLQELLDTHGRAQLFRVSNPKDRLGLTKGLVDAVAGLQPLVIPGSVGQLVQLAVSPGGEDIPGTDDSTGILRSIGLQANAPELNESASRWELLNHVGSADLTVEPVRTGVRYLLHGDPAHFRSSGTLWKDPSGRDSPWVRLWRMVAEETWNVLRGDLSACIPDKCSLVLDIRPVEQSTVTARLRQGGSFDRINASLFSGTEIDLILGQLDDEMAWRRLPLHCDQKAVFGPVTANCYLGDQPALPDNLGQTLRFIVESTEDAHRRRQRNFIPSWSSSIAAMHVLRSDKPVHHWQYLMDRLAEVATSPGSGSPWIDVAWLPLETGDAISLSSVIRLEGMSADISELAAQCDYAFAGLAELSADIRAHPNFSRLANLAPTGADALSVLAELMKNAGLTIGRSVVSAPFLVSRHKPLLAGMGSLPAWRLLFKAVDATSMDDVTTRLLGEIAVPLEMELAEQVLAELSTTVFAPQAREVFSLYIQEWASSADALVLRDRLHALVLPASDGGWKAAPELACGAFGIDPSCSLDPEFATILNGIVVKNDGMPTEPPEGAIEVPRTVDGNFEVAVERWCDPFSQSSVRAAVGALLGLFGSTAKPTAEAWLAPISYEVFLLKLNWKDPGYEEGPWPRRRWMGGIGAADQAFALLKPEFIESQGATVRVKSLIGAELTLPLAAVDAISTLLAGPLNWMGGFGVEVRMRPIECLREFGVQRQKDVLQRTAEDLLRSFYNQAHANLSDLWSLFEDADQVELDVARSLILDGLPQLMNQLSGVKKHPMIAKALNAVDKGRRDIASAQRAKADVQAPHDRLYGALGELATLVETDQSVQSALLSGIRQKVERYQYELSSIPFEIMQNADDAVVEYQVMQRAEERQPFLATDIGLFVVARTDRGAMLMHWGRPINYTGRHHGYRPEYARDLERMLMLGASAKEPEDGVTGKFGLGFKSVLLATDCPVVASGDLHFDIVAGCLPQRAELSASAKQRASQYKRYGLRPTIVELPMKADVDGLLRRFSALASLCAVFSRQIKQIEVDGATFVWQPDRLLESAGAWSELGQLQLPSKQGVSPGRILVLRCELGAIAVRIEGQPVPFDHEALHAAPSVWVNAPTRGTAASGVILNSDFEVDTGRGSLPQGAAAKRNLETARRLADGVSVMVSKLVQLTQADWTQWRARLAASPQVEVAGFWHAFWLTLFGKEPSEDASQDAQLSAANIKRLFDRVIERTGIVPNGMPGALSAFATVDKLRLSVRAGLSQVLPALASWPAFQAVYPTDSWCSEDVSAWLNSLSSSTNELSIDELDRAAIFVALGPHRHLDPNDLPRLAAVVNSWPSGPTEDQGWKNELATVQLKSRSGAWKTASSLYFSEPGQQDTLSNFAPEDVLLDVAYESHGSAWQTIGQYLTSRHLQPLDVAQWCLAASVKGSQLAVVSWLSQNLNNWMVWHHIKSFQGRGYWLFDLDEDHELLADLVAEDKGMVLVRLGLGTSADDDGLITPDPAFELDLETVHRWWQSHRLQYLPKYDQALWPQRVDRMRLADDAIDRETWMTLFSLGVFKRFGRVRDEQNRGFLDFLHTKGWWHTISQVHPDAGAEQWMGILKEYAEANQVSGEFEQWMDSFPRLYRLARWCDEYVELFRGLQFRNEQEARNLLTPATDASLSGSGFDAPTVHRTLRIGHNLVVRELLRAGVLDSEVSQSKAFMPGRAVLDLLTQMGYSGLESSEDIHATLTEQLDGADKARFEGDYDIPLILLANNLDLQRAVVLWVDQQAQVEEEASLLEEGTR